MKKILLLIILSGGFLFSKGQEYNREKDSLQLEKQLLIMRESHLYTDTSYALFYIGYTSKRKERRLKPIKVLAVFGKVIRSGYGDPMNKVFEYYVDQKGTTILPEKVISYYEFFK